MSQDPFQEREAEKYVNSIPSREFIIKHLIKLEKPTNRKELAVEFNIQGKEQNEALSRRLRAMERDGQLIFTRHQHYMIPKHINLLKGTVIGHRNGYGFLRVEEYKEDFYLSYEQMKTCIHGDQVLAYSFGTGLKGRREAKIISVIVPKTSQIVGRYFTDVNTGFVVPDDSRLNFDILIPPEEGMGARMGFIVIVELIQRQTRNTKAVGKIIEVLGSNMNSNLAVNIALRTRGIPYVWPKLVKNQIKRFREEVSEESKVDRVDLCSLPLFTIDSENSCDFDDAVYCEKKHRGGWRLWVAISDVSYYVRPNTPLDEEARNRGTSIYFPLQVIPMLPEILSNGLCSLNPQVDRLCIVCEMTISEKGLLTNYKFYEAVMRSHARLTYTKVWHILQGNRELRQQYASLVMHIEELHSLCKILYKARKNRGHISFENEEIKFIFNSEQRVKHIEQIKHNDAHKLIEECMILANISAACFIEKMKEPALFRIHDKPSIEAVATFRYILAELGLELSGGNQPESRDYAKLLACIVDRTDYGMLQTMLIRSMKQAIYNSENRGHFGLALQSYTHFTSPIRRYPDLLLHRIIKYLLATGKNKFVKESYVNGGWRYSREEIYMLGQHCSMTERRADEATREVTDWLKCDFMLSQVGNFFKGVISSITNFGFFVRLNDFFIEGLVHISSLNNDYYYFDQVGQRLVGRSGRHIYRLGDHVEVCVENININERKIHFSLIYKKNNKFLYNTNYVNINCR